MNADPIALGLSGFNPGDVGFEAGRVMLRRLHDLSEQSRTFAFETTLAAKSYAPWIVGLRNHAYGFQLSFVGSEMRISRFKELARGSGPVGTT
ncbi:MAG: hypothetical protein ACMG6H_03675 [Acidobacteriota bacterium]